MDTAKDKKQEAIETLERLAQRISWVEVSDAIKELEQHLISGNDWREEARRISQELEVTGNTFSDSTELVREDRNR